MGNYLGEHVIFNVGDRIFGHRSSLWKSGGTTVHLSRPEAALALGIEDGADVASVEPAAAAGAFVEGIRGTRVEGVCVVAVGKPSAIHGRRHRSLARVSSETIEETVLDQLLKETTHCWLKLYGINEFISDKPLT